MTDTTPTTSVTEVLAAHRDDGAKGCGCGWKQRALGGTFPHEYHAHVAAMLAPLIAQARAEGKAEGLREWIAEWPTTPDDRTFLSSVARDGLARADRVGADTPEGRALTVWCSSCLPGKPCFAHETSHAPPVPREQTSE